MAQKHADPDLERGLAPRPFPYLRVLAAVVAILLVLSVLSVWFFRASLVETAARQWCQSKSLECAITVTKIGPGGAVLDLDMGGIGRPPALIARSMTLDLVWSNPLAPVLQSVSADPALGTGRRDCPVAVSRCGRSCRRPDCPGDDFRRG